MVADNKFANQNLPEIFVGHLAATRLMDKKRVEYCHVCGFKIVETTDEAME
jgi:hypothetical protein